MIDSTLTQLSPWCYEQRFYDKEGKLIEIRKIYSERAGTIFNRMVSRSWKRTPGRKDDDINYDKGHNVND